MTFKVLIERKTVKQIDLLSHSIKKRILEALKELEKGFSARLDMKKLKGAKNHYRIRVGDYRILFVLDFETVYVYNVSRRESAYE